MTDASLRMDRMYRRQRHIYDATRKPYLLGRDRLLTQLAPPEGGSVLELGCGTARNLVVAARLYPGRALYGVDASAQMLDSAAGAVSRAGLVDCVRLALADVTRLDARISCGRETFDRVVLSYTLSMIDDWRGALASAVRLAGARGSVHIVDFGDCAGLPRVAQQALYRWLALFDVTPRRDLSQAAHAAADGRAVRIESLRAGYATHVVIAPDA